MSSYNTIPFQVRNPLQSMVGLARAMALPHEHAPQRLPSFPALERTAVMGFNTPTKLQVSSTDTRVMLARQAAFPLWADRVPDGCHFQVMDYAMQAGTGGLLLFHQPSYPIMNRTRTGSTPGPVNGFMTGNGWSAVSLSVTAPAIQCTDSMPYLGVDKECGDSPFIYIPGGASLYVQVNVGTDATGMRMQVMLERWLAPGEVVSTPMLPSTTSPPSRYQVWTDSPYSPTVGVWVRPVSAAISSGTPSTAVWGSVIVSYLPAGGTTGIVAGPNSSISWSMTATTAVTVPTFLPLSYPSEFNTSSIPWSSTRLTAVAVLGTNVTKVMNKEGVALCGRLSPERVSPFNAVSNDLLTLHPAEKQQLALETGFYTYCPPSTDLSSFLDYSVWVLGNPTPIPVYRLDNDALFNLVVLQDPDGGTVLSINLDWHIEFRSTSSLWQIGLSSVALEQLHQAQLALVASGFFFCNFDHKALLTRIASSLTSAARQLLPAAAGAVHPALGNAANQILMSSKPKNAPQPTSAKRAGWNGPPRTARLRVRVARPKTRVSSKSKGGKKKK